MTGLLHCRSCGARLGRHTEGRNLVLDGERVRVDHAAAHGLLALTCRGCGHRRTFRPDAGQAVTWRLPAARDSPRAVLVLDSET